MQKWSEKIYNNAQAITFNNQLRRISAELVDEGFLQFSEPGLYITIDKGYEFLWLRAKITRNNKI
jgi:hypothetical protein